MIIRRVKLLFLLFIFCSLAKAACPNLSEMFARIDGAGAGTPISARDLNGNQINGTIDQVLVADNGHPYFVVRDRHGNLQSHWVSSIDPRTFEGAVDSIRPNSHIQFYSKSGRPISGVARGREVIEGEDFLIIDSPNGQSMVRVSRINEASIEVLNEPVGKAILSRGPNKYLMIKNNEYISVEMGDGRFAGQVRDIRYNNYSGKYEIEVNLLNSDGSITSINRPLSELELDSLRVSTTSRNAFLGRVPIGNSNHSGFQVSAGARDIAQSYTRRYSGHVNDAQETMNTGRKVDNWINPRPRDNPSGMFWNHNDYRKYAEANGKILDGPSGTPRNLIEGQKYTYIIRDDGSMAFGQVDNSWEVGVKHMHLANTDQASKSVVAAGEVVYSNGTFSFNLESGTFMKELKHQTLKYNPGMSPDDFDQQRIELVKKVFATETNKNVTNVSHSLFDDLPDPTSRQVLEYCKEVPRFRTYNGSSLGVYSTHWCK